MTSALICRNSLCVCFNTLICIGFSVSEYTRVSVYCFVPREPVELKGVCVSFLYVCVVCMNLSLFTVLLVGLDYVVLRGDRVSSLISAVVPASLSELQHRPHCPRRPLTPISHLSCPDPSLCRHTYIHLYTISLIESPGIKVLSESF